MQGGAVQNSCVPLATVMAARRLPSCVASAQEYCGQHRGARYGRQSPFRTNVQRATVGGKESCVAAYFLISHREAVFSSGDKLLSFFPDATLYARMDQI
jgi:hypothetical protein